MTGAEYLTSAVLADLWRRMDAAFDAELAQVKLSVQEFLKSRHPAWNLVGRVHFNLAENRKDEDAPFAFLATYTTRLSAEAKAQHLPLGKALQEYAGTRNRERLLSLLTPVQRAAEHCSWLKAMVDAGEIFHALRWSPQQALQFLRDVPALESAGVVVRTPASWRMNRPARPQVKATIGAKRRHSWGWMRCSTSGWRSRSTAKDLSAAEIKQLLAQSDGLALIRGKWVEVDHERLSRTLEQFKAIEHRAVTDGLSFGEAMRMLAGAGIAGDGAAGQADVAWAETVAGPWLAETLAALRHPDRLSRADPGRSLQGTLRPYQQAGVEWLYLLAQLKLGACLADDMGLGKTYPGVVAAAGVEARGRGEAEALPAGGAGFAARQLDGGNCPICAKPPGCRRPSIGAPAEKLELDGSDDLAGVDLVITSYGYLARALARGATVAARGARRGAGDQESLRQADPDWSSSFKAETRIALTGTPIENRLGDLWSIFDFINPGLLGSSKQFSSFVKRSPSARRTRTAAARPGAPLHPAPHEDRQEHHRGLADKTEVNVFCP
jgi:non-specific serine/threonine protein kinase